MKWKSFILLSLHARFSILAKIKVAICRNMILFLMIFLSSDAFESRMLDSFYTFLYLQTTCDKNINIVCPNLFPLYPQYVYFEQYSFLSPIYRFEIGNSNSTVPSLKLKIKENYLGRHVKLLNSRKTPYFKRLEKGSFFSWNNNK